MAVAAAVISALATVAGTVMAVSASKKQARAQANNAELNAQASEFDSSVSRQNAQIALDNAALADEQAAAAERNGAFQTGQRQLQARVALATQRARLAAMGVDVNAGSSIDVQAETLTNAQLDLQAIASDTSLNASQARSQASVYRRQADTENQRSGFLLGQASFTRATGADALAAGRTNAAASVITGVGKLASNYDTYASAFVGGSKN